MASKRQSITVQIEGEMDAALEEAAAREAVKKSHIVRWAIRDWLAAHPVSAAT